MQIVPQINNWYDKWIYLCTFLTWKHLNLFEINEIPKIENGETINTSQFLFKFFNSYTKYLRNLN